MSRSANSVKVSKWRQTQAKLSKPESHILNVNPTGAIWDGSNLMATNGKYLAVPWKNPGSVVVLPADFAGKLSTNPASMLQGHQGNVIDCAFDPYQEDLLFTASEDCTIKGWKLSEGLAGVNEATVPVTTLSGHGKKVGILSFHPSAAGVLASAGFDGTINMWDVASARPAAAFKDAGDQIMSLNFNLDGSLLNITTRDKRVSILDSRTGAMVASAASHEGSKAQRSIWAKRRNLIVTFGFTSAQYRELKVWDVRNMSKPAAARELDQQTGVMLPFVDEDTGMVYVGGKGDGGIKYFDLWDDESVITPLNAWASTEAAKGLCMLPKKYLDVRACEVARFYKMTTKSIATISFVLPRKACDVEFQDDVYPPTFADEPALKASEFFGGANSNPKELDLRGLFDKAPLRVMPPCSPTSPSGGSQSLGDRQDTTDSNAGSKASPTPISSTPNASVAEPSPSPTASNPPARVTSPPPTTTTANPPARGSTPPDDLARTAPAPANKEAPPRSPSSETPESPQSPPTPSSTPAAGLLPRPTTFENVNFLNSGTTALAAQQAVVEYLTRQLEIERARLDLLRQQFSKSGTPPPQQGGAESPVSLGSPNYRAAPAAKPKASNLLRSDSDSEDQL